MSSRLCQVLTPGHSMSREELRMSKVVQFQRTVIVVNDRQTVETENYDEASL